MRRPPTADERRVVDQQRRAGARETRRPPARVSRQRASGLRRSVPSPEQGASTSTRSAARPAAAFGDVARPGLDRRALRRWSARRGARGGAAPPASCRRCRAPAPAPCPPAPRPAPASCRPRPRRRRPRARPAAARPARRPAGCPRPSPRTGPSRNAASPNALTRVSNTSPTGDSGVGPRGDVLLGRAAPISASRVDRAPCSRAPPAARAGSSPRPAPSPPPPRSPSTHALEQPGRDTTAAIASRSRPRRAAQARVRRRPRAPDRIGSRSRRFASPASASTGTPPRAS